MKKLKAFLVNTLFFMFIGFLSAELSSTIHHVFELFGPDYIYLINVG